jgi:hypothetical protein
MPFSSFSPAASTFSGLKVMPAAAVDIESGPCGFWQAKSFLFSELI